MGYILSIIVKFVYSRLFAYYKGDALNSVKIKAIVAAGDIKVNLLAKVATILGFLMRLNSMVSNEKKKITLPLH